MFNHSIPDELYEWAQTKWKRLNTGYCYKVNIEDLLNMDSWEVTGEYHDPIQDKIKRWLYDCWPRRKLRDLKYWVAHRTYDKYHLVWTGRSPGYADKDSQMAGCIFQLLKDFFEKEEDKEVVRWISRPYENHPMWCCDDLEEMRDQWDRWQPIYALYLKVKDKQPWDFVDGLDDSQLTEILIEVIKLRSFLWT